MNPIIEDFVKEHLISTRLITCVLPDDGTHRELIQVLSESEIAIDNIQIADSTRCRGEFISKSETKVTNGSPMQMVQIVVKERVAEELFEYLCELSKIGRPDGGFITMSEPISATPYTPPSDMPHENL